VSARLVLAVTAIVCATILAAVIIGASILKDDDNPGRPREQYVECGLTANRMHPDCD
jgi:hypothetical protein